MEKAKDGGSAFPVIQEDMTGVDGGPGMTLRDYFAAKALTGIFLADEKARLEIGGDRRYSSADEFARAAYDQADAMLEARKPKATTV